MNNIADFHKCANCGACYNICPVNAITIEDSLFYQVTVDNQKCINCGLCQKVCPINTPQAAQSLLQAYAAIHNDPHIVKASSSGGVFSALAENILQNGGVVYGAAYEDGCKEVSVKSTKTVPLETLRRSKYVESKVGLSFRELKHDLESGKTILYCAAPCQIAGLKRYLGKDHENLITCDFSCGGMPSHKIYQEYLEEIEKKLKAPVQEVNFRPKTYGWKFHAINIKATNGRSFNKLAANDPYFHCFIGNHYSIRDYCCECEFADNHHSDLILADFWKYSSISNVCNRNEGISLVLSNSQKGDQFLHANAKTLALTVLPLKEAAYNIRNHSYDSAFMNARNAFLEQCTKAGFWRTIQQKKLPSTWLFRLKYFLYIRRRLEKS